MKYTQSADDMNSEIGYHITSQFINIIRRSFIYADHIVSTPETTTVI